MRMMAELLFENVYGRKPNIESTYDNMELELIMLDLEYAVENAYTRSSR